MKRSSWTSQLGFVFAAAGSAVGLANIWRFPFIVGNNGGALFVFLYFLCLLFIGFPVFVSEVLIGRKTQRNPGEAFEMLGKSKLWGIMGKMTILTGFIVSAFYCAVAGWIVGYFFEALIGNLVLVETAEVARAKHELLMSNTLWGLGFFALFLLTSYSVLIFGVRGGIERGNKIIMPTLYLILIILVYKGLSMKGSWEGIEFLFQPDFNEITPQMFLIALGQSFFTLSIGQGTMVTYGSYMGKDDNILGSGFIVTVMDTAVSILSAIIVFSIVFAVGLNPDEGPSLLFKTLPLVFSQIPGGYFVSVLFFLLVLLAALTSQISAMEPSIAYLIDRFQMSRAKATNLVTLGVFLLGIPCALSATVLSGVQIFGMNPMELMIFLTLSILIPLGGFLAVLLVGWRWGIASAIPELFVGLPARLKESRLFNSYIRLSLKFLAPLLILVVFLSAVGLI